MKAIQVSKCIFLIVIMFLGLECLTQGQSSIENKALQQENLKIRQELEQSNKNLRLKLNKLSERIQNLETRPPWDSVHFNNRLIAQNDFEFRPEYYPGSVANNLSYFLLFSTFALMICTGLLMWRISHLKTRMESMVVQHQNPPSTEEIIEETEVLITEVEPLEEKNMAELAVTVNLSEEESYVQDIANDGEEESYMQDIANDGEQSIASTIKDTNPGLDLKEELQTIDHSFALSIADEIIRLNKNLSNMDTDIKGIKQLLASVKRLEDNFVTNHYNIPDLLGKSFDPGMKIIVANSIIDENLRYGEEIITRIIKPQVNYRGVMIQAAQVEVSIGH